MKKIIIPFLLISGTYILSACGGNSSSTPSTAADSVTTTSNMGDSMNGIKKDSMNINNSGSAMVDAKAKDFANKAATGGMMEVELSKIAEQKASSQQVKDFGKMMVTDHTRANDNFKAIATKKSIDLPAAVTDDQRKEIDDLSKKSGKDFDKAYVDMMVEDHKTDIKEFKDAESSVADNDIKTFITTTLPTLQKHLDAIQAIKSKM